MCAGYVARAEGSRCFHNFIGSPFYQGVKKSFHLNQGMGIWGQNPEVSIWAQNGLKCGVENVAQLGS